MTRPSELRELSDDELDHRLTERRQELFNLRFQSVTGALENSARLKLTKREIARILDGRDRAEVRGSEGEIEMADEETTTETTEETPAAEPVAEVEEAAGGGACGRGGGDSAVARACCCRGARRLRPKPSLRKLRHPSPKPNRPDPHRSRSRRRSTSGCPARCARRRGAVTRTPATERKPISREPKPEHDRGRRQERRGVVVSDAMDKTIVVKVDTIRSHPRYKKVDPPLDRSSTRTTRQNPRKVGDVVRIVETRPLSKTKNWRLAEIVEVAK